MKNVHGAMTTAAKETARVVSTGVHGATEIGKGAVKMATRGANALATGTSNAIGHTANNIALARGKINTAEHALQKKMVPLTTQQQLSRENTMNLIKVRGQKLANPQRSEVDVNIHGTFARSEPWTGANSDFTRETTANRETNKAAFKWTGGGSEGARETAGANLGNYLNDVKNKFVMGEGAEINAIAHSHGGNVLGKAMSRDDTTSIQNAVMLGTPAMSKRGQNTSWSTEGADKVEGHIHNVYDKADKIQTTGARANEIVRGNANIVTGLVTGNRLSVGREFENASSTPQHNVEVQTKRSVLERINPMTKANAHSELHDAHIGRQVNKMLSTPQPNTNTRQTLAVTRDKK